jgi:folate-binding protein YgfZ
MTPPTLLASRAIVSVNGPDAENFLHGLLTQATLDMKTGERRYGALLTPQGKVIADMILERTSEGFLLDCARSSAQALAKRLSMFRLRAKVTIAEEPELHVMAFDGAPDPRSPEAPARRIVRSAEASVSSPDAYRAAFIAAGLPEQGIDFGPEEVFPADINMDLLSGVDFKKGCFTGQEVVSRMKRRATARRRTLRVTLPDGAPITPAPILTGDLEIGSLTSHVGEAGLARLRIDRMHEALTAGEAITAGGKPVAFDRPPWLAGELAALGKAL